jgi:hypothetical protein
MHSFIQQYGHSAQVEIMTWLQKAGIITENKNYDLKIDKDKVAYEFFEKVDNVLSRRGYDDNYVDREYERQARLSEGRFVNDASDVVKNPSISLQQFFTKYLMREHDLNTQVIKYVSHKDSGADAQKAIFDNLIKDFHDPTTDEQYFRKNAIKEIMDKVAIESNGDTILMRELGQRKRKEIVEDITQIVFARKNIKIGKQIRIHPDGLRVEDKPYYMQKNEITNLFDEMQVELILFNSDVIVRGFNPFTNKHETKLSNSTRKS